MQSKHIGEAFMVDYQFQYIMEPKDKNPTWNRENPRKKS